MSAWEKVRKIYSFDPISNLVLNGVEKAAASITAASAQGVVSLQEEATKQRLQMELAREQARVAQELAIARRIDSAEEVEIEEFYDVSGKGNLNVGVDAATSTGSIGLGGEGRKVTKRIYHFKGWRDMDAEEVEQES